MIPNLPQWRRAHGLLVGGLALVEYVGLIVVGFATTFAMIEETAGMIRAAQVTLADLLLMFLYLEVLAMIGQYFRAGQLPVRFPLYIAMVAMARYIILDIKDLTELRMLAVSGAILLLTLAVLVIRYGHTKFPYREGQAEDAEIPTPGPR